MSSILVHRCGFSGAVDATRDVPCARSCSGASASTRCSSTALRPPTVPGLFGQSLCLHHSPRRCCSPLDPADLAVLVTQKALCLWHLGLVDTRFGRILHQFDILQLGFGQLDHLSASLFRSDGTRGRRQLCALAKKSGGKYDYDLVIIGCGVGGHGAALHAVECVSSPLHAAD